MIPFFVLSGSKNNCNDAEQVLKTVWKMNIRNCYFVCFDSEQTPFVFTFNPYSKYAPDQWKTVREITEKFNYMTIYNRVYNKKNICKGLHFDRTKYLDRAVLNFALCMPPSQVIPLSKLTEKNHHLIYSHFEGDIFEMLKIGLKVSLNYNYDLEPFNHTSKPSGVCNLLLNKTSDVAVCLFNQQFMFDFLPSHQIIYTGFSIFSKNRGFFTPLE
ncbi:uncharacterized protein LOC123273318 [Cotesia glomerata]|uniref:uncharacterized protein LOC123273318 n=1 Tax=Cotesia glomerata TaxID=32391 RepID=UPI001D023BBB|nr:uncharacterized protein LOC123273318 [Cotesia glomerata]